MQKMRYIVIFLLGCAMFFPTFSFAENLTIDHVNLQEVDGNTTLTISGNKQLTFKIFSLENPDRVVLDIAKTKPFSSLPSPSSSPFITALRAAPKEDGSLRIVLETKTKPFDVKATTSLPDESGKYQLKLIITHAPTSFEEMIDLALKDAPTPSPNPTHTNQAESLATIAPTPTPRPQERYKPTIIIDAGHGGHDPGSIGQRGTKEKMITLAFAKELYHRLKETGLYNPILTRSNDSYITLRGRVEIARKHNADLFISLHADSHNNPHVKGMSIYTLSDTASDKEAAALARKENKSDIISGIDFQHEDRDIANVLISIAQRDTMNQSALFAERIVKSAESQITLLRNPHRFAGFRVLTAADVPSVLIELGYLSNYREEKLLNSEKHKKELVQILIKAINAQF